MSDCEDCNALMATLFDGTRWVLAHETQTCIWESPASLAEVAVKDRSSFAYFCCEEHAIEGIEQHLLQAGATAQWSDVRPIDTRALRRGFRHRAAAQSACAFDMCD